MFGKNINCNIWVHVKERDDGIENNKAGGGGGILNFTQRYQGQKYGYNYLVLCFLMESWC